MAHSSPRSTLLADGRGRSTAQRELEDHIRALRRYAYVLVGRSANADDLVQEALKRAIGHLREGKQINNLRSYLLTILHNVRNDDLKREKRLGRPVPLDEDLELAMPPSQLRHIQCREVAEIIDTLPEDQREVLLLVGLEGTSYLDATKILHIPLGTVMSRLNRGRNAIRNRLRMEPVDAAKQRASRAAPQLKSERSADAGRLPKGRQHPTEARKANGRDRATPPAMTSATPSTGPSGRLKSQASRLKSKQGARATADER